MSSTKKSYEGSKLRRNIEEGTKINYCLEQLIHLLEQLPQEQLPQEQLPQEQLPQEQLPQRTYLSKEEIEKFLKQLRKEEQQAWNLIKNILGENWLEGIIDYIKGKDFFVGNINRLPQVSEIYRYITLYYLLLILISQEQSSKKKEKLNHFRGLIKNKIIGFLKSLFENLPEKERPEFESEIKDVTENIGKSEDGGNIENVENILMRVKKLSDDMQQIIETNKKERELERKRKEEKIEKLFEETLRRRIETFFWNFEGGRQELSIRESTIEEFLKRKARRRTKKEFYELISLCLGGPSVFIQNIEKSLINKLEKLKSSLENFSEEQSEEKEEIINQIYGIVRNLTILSYLKEKLPIEWEEFLKFFNELINNVRKLIENQPENRFEINLEEINTYLEKIKKEYQIGEILSGQLTLEDLLGALVSINKQAKEFHKKVERAQKKIEELKDYASSLYRRKIAHQPEKDRRRYEIEALKKWLEEQGILTFNDLLNVEKKEAGEILVKLDEEIRKSYNRDDTLIFFIENFADTDLFKKFIQIFNRLRKENIYEIIAHQMRTKTLVADISNPSHRIYFKAALFLNTMNELRSKFKSIIQSILSIKEDITSEEVSRILGAAISLNNIVMNNLDLEEISEILTHDLNKGRETIIAALQCLHYQYPERKMIISSEVIEKHEGDIESFKAIGEVLLHYGFDVTLYVLGGDTDVIISWGEGRGGLRNEPSLEELKNNVSQVTESQRTKNLSNAKIFIENLSRLNPDLLYVRLITEWLKENNMFEEWIKLTYLIYQMLNQILKANEPWVKANVKIISPEEIEDFINKEHLSHVRVLTNWTRDDSRSFTLWHLAQNIALGLVLFRKGIKIIAIIGISPVLRMLEIAKKLWQSQKTGPENAVLLALPNAIRGILPVLRERGEEIDLTTEQRV